MTTEELIKKLRGAGVPYPPDYYGQAADRLEQHQAEIERLREALEKIEAVANGQYPLPDDLFRAKDIARAALKGTDQ